VRPRQTRCYLFELAKRNLLILSMKRRVAIRAVRFDPKPTLSSRYEKREFHRTDEKRGSFEGAIRIPLRALSFLSRNSILSPLESVDLDIEFLAHTTTPKGWPVLFNNLVFLRVPRKSLNFHWFLFSIPNTPNNHIQRRWGYRSH